MAKRNLTPATLIGALLLVLGAAVIYLVRETRPVEATPPGPGRTEEPLPQAKLVQAAEPEPEGAAERRIEEQLPDPASSPQGPTGGESAPFKGQLVDLATDEPVPYAMLVAGPVQAPVGADGRWSAERLPADVDSIEFHNPIQGTHIRSIRRRDLEPVGDEWLARIAIGPTYRLRILDSSGASRPEWRARLVEILEDGSEARGSWIVLHPEVGSQPPFLRYDNPWEPNAPGSVYRVDVRSSHATLLGSSGRIDSAVGIYPEIVTVRIDTRLASAHGRVVNVADEPIQRARVILAPVGAGGFGEEAEEWPTDHTESDGTYRFPGVTPGTYRIHVHPRRGEAPQSRTEELRPGDNRLDDFVFAVQEGAGMIEGKLVSRSGRGFEHDEIVSLKAVDGRTFEIVDISSSGGRIQSPFRRNVRARGEEGEHVFEFNEVPAGQYELTVVAQDGYAWTPAFVRVEPPNDEVVFYREDDVPHHKLAFEVFASGTEERIDRFTVQYQIGTTWNAAATELGFGESLGPFPIQAASSWTVHAPGYQPARGNARSMPAEAVARVGLKPGWGVQLTLRDLGHGIHSDDEDGRMAAAHRPPVAGAEIWIDGELAAATGPDGTARLERPQEPEKISVRAPGWCVVGSELFRAGRIQGAARDVVVWMVRE